MSHVLRYVPPSPIVSKNQLRWLCAAKREVAGSVPGRVGLIAMVAKCKKKKKKKLKLSTMHWVHIIGPRLVKIKPESLHHCVADYHIVVLARKTPEFN